MGNVLGWFGLKKPQPSPKVSRRERSPPLRSEKSKCQDAHQSAESCTSSQSEEDPPEFKVSSPPKPETPASISKPTTVTVQSSPKPERGPAPVRPPAPKCNIDEISSKAQENVQSLANIAKEEVKNLTESISRTSVDSADGLVKIISSTSRTTTLIQESTTPSVTSTDVGQVQARVVASSELVKNAEPFEMVSVCPTVAVCPPCIDETESGGEDSTQSMIQETAEEAAVKIQAGIRGYLTRKALKDRFSPAPESLSERQTETSESKSDTETEKSTSKTSSTEVEITTVKTAGISPRAQDTTTHGQEVHEMKVTIAIKPTEPVQKEESSVRPAGVTKTQAQPQSQVAGALGNTSQIAQAQTTQQITSSKVNAPVQEDEEEWDEEEEEEEEEGIVLEDEEPTPPASPPIQVKKQAPPSATPPIQVKKQAPPPASPPIQVKKQAPPPPGVPSSNKTKKQ